MQDVSGGVSSLSWGVEAGTLEWESSHHHCVPKAGVTQTQQDPRWVGSLPPQHAPR